MVSEVFAWVLVGVLADSKGDLKKERAKLNYASPPLDYQMSPD